MALSVHTTTIALALLALFVSPALGAVTVADQVAAYEQRRAAAWIQRHTGSAATGVVGPDQDELAELKRENPESYALVKALLAKNALGLIKRKDDAPAAAVVLDDDGRSVDTSDVETPAAAVAPSGGHSYFNWKPADDSSMVKDVLGKVAGLSALASRRSAQTSTEEEGVRNTAWAASSTQSAASTATTWKSAETADVATTTKVSAAGLARSTDTIEEATGQRARSGTAVSAVSAVSQTDEDAIFQRGATVAAGEASGGSGSSAGSQQKSSTGGWGDFLSSITKGSKKTAPAKTASASAAQQENSYLKGFDWGTSATASLVSTRKIHGSEISGNNAYAHFLS